MVFSIHLIHFYTILHPRSRYFNIFYAGMQAHHPLKYVLPYHAGSSQWVAHLLALLFWYCWLFWDEVEKCWSSRSRLRCRLSWMP